ncbi:peptide alpha N acetyltransferase [Echinococcus multilocularis]|uniref:Peptide alpha N acetyltransferase n=1 Tax=Echinococcus multilocularis TaxID=6211 RepID=A0A068YD11_ECHMU|nr:peptide alpha N acetyltransferase [Echinococcus multilocularis]
MYSDLESNEQRLRDAFEILGVRSSKLTNSLKRTRNRLPQISAKMVEACEIMSSLMGETHTDRDTLNFMSTFFRELDKEETLQSYLTTALEKFPDNEDLLVCLFFIHVRKCNFNAQQAIARKLCQQNPLDRGFRFWMALSTVLQGEKDAALAKRMFLPLAERILEKALNEGYFRSHKDLHFYISVLKRMGKYSKALGLLTDSSVMDKINEQDYQHDYSDCLLELNAELGDWSEMVRIATVMLEKDSDNWSAWKTLLQHGFQDEDKTKVLLSLIDRFVKQSPNCRGPYLALIDFSANLIKRGIQHPNAEESFCINLANQFFAKYGRKPIGALDLSYVLPFLIKSEEKRLSFIGTLLKEIHYKHKLSSLSDDENVHYEVCAYRLARTNGVPLNVTDLISAYQLHAKRTQLLGKDAPKEIAPADGLLQLAISEVLDPMVEPSSCENSFGRLLLAAYWLAEIGLKYSPANHLMRLRLSSILSPCGGLACIGRQLKELMLLNLKEALNVSIGYAAMAPGPVLTIFGNRPLSTTLPDQTNVNLIKYHEMMVSKVRSIQRETESWLVCAYRRQTFSRIHEYTQFLYKLGHSDSLLLAQSELIYYKVLVASNSFDDALEQMGNFASEVASVKEALLNVCDNRDFSVIPEFSRRKPDPENQKRCFDHLCAWMNFRLDVVNLFGACSKLVMKAVPCIDQIGSGELSDESRKDLKDLVETIENQSNSLISRMKAMEVVTSFDCTKFKYVDLLLTSEAIFISPPPLPKTNMMSFYVHGPFTQILMAGIDLLKYLTALLDNASNEPLDMEKCALPRCLSEPLLQFIGESPGIPSLPSPPQADSSLPGLLNPSSVLVGFGVAMETLAMATLFITAAVAMLRPRRLVHQPLQNRSKKNKKKQQHKVDVETITASPPARHLDQVAALIRAVVIPQLQYVATSLRKLAEDWAGWVSTMAPKAFTATAMQASRAALPKALDENKFFPWHPESKKECPLIYKEMADDLARGFNELFGACKRKLLALDGAFIEVGCFTTAVED